MAKNDKQPITFILLDDSIVTYGFRVSTDGVDLDQFKRNPVMLIDHNDTKLPIGKWTNIRKKSGQILADAAFDYEDTDLEVQRIIGKVERGVIAMASAGLRDIELSDDQALKIEGQKLPTISKSRMREASIVSIGANHNALRLYDKDDKEIDLSDEIKLSEFIKPLNINPIMNEELLKALDLSDKAKDEDVVAAIVALKDGLQTAQNDRDTLQAKLNQLELADKEGNKNRFAALVDQAIKDGRINAAGKDHLIKLHDANPNEAESFLSSIPERKSTYAQLVGGQQNTTTELSDLLSKSWDELDKSGKLITLKDKYPDAYNDKFKEKFGKEPQS